MQNFDIDELLRLQSAYNSDEHIREPIGRLSATFDPLSTLPDPLQSEIPASSSPSSPPASSVSPALTEEEAAHVDNLLFWGVDSPVLPPDLVTRSLGALDEMPPDPGTVPPSAPSTIPTTSSASPLLASSALFSPNTVYATPSPSPQTLKRSFSLMDLPDQFQEPPPPSPSPLPPSKRPCTSFPGESSFQLDRTVTPLKPPQSTGQSMAKPRESRPDYSACKCPGGLTSKPARHWRVCPYNPEAGAKRFVCEYCEKRFGREDNKKRHIKEYHPETILSGPPPLGQQPTATPWEMTSAEQPQGLQGPPFQSRHIT